MIAQASPAAGPLQTDPSKRVNYTLGLVLGVDEFQQDQLYHAAGRRGHNRLLHGYGTVWGLRVNPISSGPDPEIQVERGVAVDPCGREICVENLMCVRLTQWLDRHRASLEALYPDPTLQPIPLAVILCHRECPTDTVPVPGEPCRSQEDAMQPSRIRESFELKLALRDDAPWGSPPTADPTGIATFRFSQPEEQAVRAFGLLLARVTTTTDPELSLTGRDELLAGVRALESAAAEATLASPPAPNDDPILLPAATAPEILREALRVWVTEVRPKIRALESPSVCGDLDGECCVLLSEIDLAVTADWAVAEGEIESVEDRRPYLLHTRLLQEWLIAGGAEEGRSDVDSWATLQILGPDRVRLWVHHEAWLDIPKSAVTLVLNDNVLPPDAILSLPYAGIRNVWDAVLAQEMSDGDVLEVRFDTTQVEIISPPPPSVDQFIFGTFGQNEWISQKVLAAAQKTGDQTLVRSISRPSAASIDVGFGDANVVTAFDPQLGTRNPAVKSGFGSRFAQPVEEQKVLTEKLFVDVPGGEKTIDEGVLEEIIVRTRSLRSGWSPSTAERTGVKVADELRGPTGEYLDRYGWSLSAFTIYDRLEGGDLEGEYSLPIVAKIQQFPVDPAAPLADQYLVSDGAKWLPRHLPDATNDLRGRYPACQVVGLQGRRVSEAAPEIDQYLVWDGEQWVPAFLPDGTADLAGRYPGSTVVGIQSVPVSNATPKAEQYLKFDAVTKQWGPFDLPDAQLDLAGKYPQLTIARLQGRDVAATNPAANQLLAFVGNRWIPTGITNILGGAGGDVTGFFHALTVGRLRGRAIASTAPTEGQALVFRESSPPGNGQWTPQAVATTVAFAGTSDLSGYPNTEIVRLQGKTVNAATPANGQVLQYQETAPNTGRWVPAAVAGGSTGPAGGDLTGTYPNPTINRLQGVPVNASKPVQDNYLMFNGEAWVPAAGPTGGSTAYEVIAAASFTVVTDSGVQHEAAPFNGLTLIPRGNLTFDLAGFPYDPDRFVHIVKGTAGAGAVTLPKRGTTALSIKIVPLAGSEERTLHLEVSRYPRQPFDARTVATGTTTSTTGTPTAGTPTTPTIGTIATGPTIGTATPAINPTITPR